MSAPLPSLTNTLNHFAQVFDRGRTALGVDAVHLFNLLVTMEVVLAGLYLALGSGGELARVARKILVIGFFYWVIQDYENILRVVIDGFLYAGQKAGSASSLNFATLQDPDKIVTQGFKIAEPAFTKLYEGTAETWFGIPTLDMLIVAFCSIVGVIAFIIMAVQVFVTYLEYLLVSALGFILIPFAVFKPTAFIAERVFGSIVAFGIKLMTLALIIAVAGGFMETMQIPTEVTWQNSFDFLVISLALCFLALHAPSVALSLFSGAPQLSADAITSAVRSGVASSSVAIGGASQINSLAIQGASTTARGAAAASGAVAGGSIAAWRSQGSISEQPTLHGKIARLGSKTALSVAGSAAGLVSGVSSSVASVASNGITPASTAISSSFRSGLASVPQYRKQMAKEPKARTNPEKQIDHNSKEPK